MTIIFHITSHKDWLAAQIGGEYRAASLATQGFIHCSTAEQVVPVANTIFWGQSGLILLCIDVEKLVSPVVFEPPVNPQTGQPEPGSLALFPHVYGPINTNAVLRVLDFPPQADGSFMLPDGARGC
jgi:uncharacterized protein (DUF952 family)